MRRILTLISVLAAIAGTTIMAAGPAAALGAEWVGCRVVPTTPDIQFTQYCANRTLIVGTYTAGFQVFNTS
ncbi:hypothetical protein, partial [Actinophytocola sp.]|uniref:hypothetical protein n=1 Tax=Actinophytocola sp. TaxID=1872138 RepID=UPI00389B1619